MKESQPQSNISDFTAEKNKRERSEIVIATQESSNEARMFVQHDTTLLLEFIRVNDGILDAPGIDKKEKIQLREFLYRMVKTIFNSGTFEEKDVSVTNVIEALIRTDHTDNYADALQGIIDISVSYLARIDDERDQDAEIISLHGEPIPQGETISITDALERRSDILLTTIQEFRSEAEAASVSTPEANMRENYLAIKRRAELLLGQLELLDKEISIEHPDKLPEYTKNFIASETSLIKIIHFVNNNLPTA